MRRLLPWLATTLVAVGAGAAGVVGAFGLPRPPAAAWVTQLPSRSPSAWVARVLATTRAAGTALLSSTTTEHLSFASSTSSSPSASNGSYQPRTFEFQISGAVDFTTHRLETNAMAGGHPLDHDVQLGRTLFATELHARGALPSHRKYLSPVGVLGSLAYEEPYTPYDPLATPAATIGVKPLGVGTVGGIDVWAYRLVGRSCAPATALPVVIVWVDARGRLVQIHTALQATVPPPKQPSGYPRPPVQHVSLSEMTTFSDFGNPVAIRQTVPPTQFAAPEGSGELPAPNTHCRG